MCRGQVGRVFTGDPELLKVTSTVMILMAGYIGCDGLQTVLGGILRGTGRQASAVPVIFFSYYILALPAAFLFAFVFHWGVRPSPAAVSRVVSQALYWCSGDACRKC